MPIGSFALTPHIAQLLCARQPRRVLDLGIGFGFYGAVVRQWIDLGVKPFRTELFGVEAWAEYRSPLWDLYDVVFVETIDRFLARPHADFDCILFSDVIEHFSKAEGARILAALRQRAAPGGHLVVGTPAAFVPQGAAFGNPLEQHRSLWTVDDFRRLGFRAEIHGRRDWCSGETILAIWRRDI